MKNRLILLLHHNHLLHRHRHRIRRHHYHHRAQKVGDGAAEVDPDHLRQV